MLDIVAITLDTVVFFCGFVAVISDKDQSIRITGLVIMFLMALNLSVLWP